MKSEFDISGRIRGAIYSRVLIILAVGLVVLAAVALIPGEERVVRGLLKDGASDRLKALAAKRMELHPDEAMLPFLSERLREEQWQDPAVFSTVLTMVDGSSRPSSVFESLQRVKVPDAQKTAIAVALSLNVRSSDAELKEELGEFIRITMPKTPDAVLAAVQAYRRSGETGAAFDLMHGLAAGVELQRLPDRFLEIYRDLAFETEHQHVGYTVARHQWNSVINSSGENDLESGRLDEELNKFIVAAHRSGELSEACQALEKRLSVNSLLQAPLHLLVNSGASESEELRDFGRQLAQFSEWNADPGRAFDLYGRLAMLGDVEARKRCHALQPGLFRGEEMMQILLQNEEDLDVAELHQLADLVGNAGRMNDAKRIYFKLLQQLPEERVQLQTKLGLLLDENGQSLEALELLKDAYASRSDVKAGAALGRALVSSGKYGEALDHYAAMPEYDQESTSGYLYLATAMGDEESAIAAMEARLGHSKTPIVTDFVELAEAYSRQGRFLESENVFLDGLNHHPESRELTLRYIVMLGSSGQHSKALDLLLNQPDYSEDPAAVARLVDLEISPQDFPRVLKWLGGAGVEDRISLSEDGKALVADIYLQTGRKKQALALIEELSDEPRFMWMKAMVYFVSGQYVDAERLQSRFVAGTGRGSAEAWRQLGRTRRALGDERAARECFAMALSILNVSQSKDGETTSITQFQNER